MQLHPGKDIKRKHYAIPCQKNFSMKMESVLELLRDHDMYHQEKMLRKLFKQKSRTPDPPTIEQCWVVLAFLLFAVLVVATGVGCLIAICLDVNLSAVPVYFTGITIIVTIVVFAWVWIAQPRIERGICWRHDSTFQHQPEYS